MSFAISLCHFCDHHGPSILLTCYLASEDEELSNSNVISCKACSMPEEYISVDPVSGSRYVSCRMPAQRPSLVSWLNHVCVRSLSCELNPCLFAEPPSCALSVSFSVRDAHARGFHRWLSVVVCGRDLPLLASSWSFLDRNIQNVISWLQEKSTQVYNMERPFRDSESTQYRPLTQLTRSKVVYARMHCWFSWMIQACNSRLAERIARSSYLKFQPSCIFDEANLKSLHAFLGPDIFTQAAMFLFEGRQVVIRGDIPSLVQATVNTLKRLLPGDWCRAVVDGDDYLEAPRCRLLGVSCLVAVPRPCADILRIDIVQGRVAAKNTQPWPRKVPSLVSKVMKALENDLLRGKALDYLLQTFHLEWIHIAKLAYLTRMENNTTLLAALGVKPQDQQLLSYWSSNLFKT